MIRFYLLLLLTFILQNPLLQANNDCLYNNFIQTQSSNLEYNLHLSAWAGASWMKNHYHSADLHFQTGIATGLAGSLTFCNYYKIQLEGLYLQNQISDLKINHQSLGFKGNVRNYSALANFIIEIPLPYSFYTHLGGGAGYGYEHLDIHAKNLESIKDHESNFVFQGLAGLSCPIFCSDSWQIDGVIQGRYFVLEKHLRTFILSGGIDWEF